MPGIMDIINPATAIADTTINPLMQWRTNVANRQFSREMYKRQREDSLSDWEMQNAYNSPKAQMERFKEAGLNPHLIYGQSNTANPVRSSSPQGGQAEAPKVSASNSLANMYDLKMREATIDQTHEATKNLIKQRDVMDTDMIAKLKMAGLNDARIQEIMQNLDQKKTAFPHQLENLKLSNEKLKVDTAKSGMDIYKMAVDARVSLSDMARRVLETNQQIKESNARINKMIYDVENVKADTWVKNQTYNKLEAEVTKIKAEARGTALENEIKGFEVRMRQNNIMPGTPSWYRAWQLFLKEAHEPTRSTPGIKPWSGQSNPLKR